ncbi:hypothetical protein NCC49_000169 [Naganishia albida]|nr:hypothetical protein NCC49_000169 [Naganishia albida]
MSRRGNNTQSKGQFSRGLTYQEQHVPAFLQKLRAQVNGGNTGPRRSGDDDDESPHVVDRRSASPPASRGGRETLPERPREGKWAEGSDDEEQGGKKRKGDDEDDEWAQRYGGGDDAPQIVVLNEGKHLSAEEVKRVKEGNTAGDSFDTIAAQNKSLHTAITGKRKNPPTSVATTKPVEPPKSVKQLKREKKKEKEKKSLLSFDDV